VRDVLIDERCQQGVVRRGQSVVHATLTATRFLTLGSG
jgi:hypothetical protein